MSTKELLKSVDCLLVISEFMAPADVLSWNQLSKKFYDDNVPKIMNKRAMFPQINNEMHFFMKEKKLYGMTLTNNTPSREIDFEEDPWRQDYQYVLVPPNEEVAKTMDFKACLLIDLTDHVEKDEVILPHYICRINKFKVAIFLLKESKQITRGLLVEFSPYSQQTVKPLKGPPIDLFRPGCAPQYLEGKILNDILFLGGNE